MKEFVINNYIKLKLENNKTIIYLKGLKFGQCKKLALMIPKKDLSLYKKLNSIDELVDVNNLNHQNINISSEEEFWGHCSNLQIWVEHDYDTRLLHSELAFPLLEEFFSLQV